MPVGDQFLVKHAYRVGLREVSNTTYWQELDQPTSPDECALLAQAYVSQIVAELMTMLSNEVQSNYVRVWCITADLAPATALSVTSFGSVVADPLPANKNIKFQFRQNSITSRANGEMRVAGIPETESSGNNYTGAGTHAVAINNLIDRFTNQITDGQPTPGNWRLQIKSSSAALVPPPPPAQYLDVTNASLSTLIYSDRRRTSRNTALMA